MGKQLIFGMALSLLFVSGLSFSAQACELAFNGCMPPNYSSLCGTTCVSKDMDKNTMTKQESPATSQGPSKSDANKKNGF
ncbi:MAG: hypothetical protein ACLQVJ_02810 [Syntrophobacteraceae bacterium]